MEVRPGIVETATEVLISLREESVVRYETAISGDSGNRVESLPQVANVIRDVSKRYPHLRKVAVFGSFARGEQTSRSDVDVLALADDGTGPSEYNEIGFSLADALGRDVDFISSLEGSPKYFTDSIKRDGVVVYER